VFCLAPALVVTAVVVAFVARSAWAGGTILGVAVLLSLGVLAGKPAITAAAKLTVSFTFMRNDRASAFLVGRKALDDHLQLFVMDSEGLRQSLSRVKLDVTSFHSETLCLKSLSTLRGLLAATEVQRLPSWFVQNKNSLASCLAAIVAKERHSASEAHATSAFTKAKAQEMENAAITIRDFLAQSHRGRSVLNLIRGSCETMLQEIGGQAYSTLAAEEARSPWSDPGHQEADLSDLVDLAALTAAAEAANKDASFRIEDRLRPFIEDTKKECERRIQDAQSEYENKSEREKDSFDHELQVLSQQQAHANREENDQRTLHGSCNELRQTAKRRVEDLSNSLDDLKARKAELQQQAAQWDGTGADDSEVAYQRAKAQADLGDVRVQMKTVSARLDAAERDLAEAVQRLSDSSEKWERAEKRQKEANEQVDSCKRRKQLSLQALEEQLCEQKARIQEAADEDVKRIRGPVAILAAEYGTVMRVVEDFRANAVPFVPRIGEHLGRVTSGRSFDGAKLRQSAVESILKDILGQIDAFEKAYRDSRQLLSRSRIKLRIDADRVDYLVPMWFIEFGRRLIGRRRRIAFYGPCIWKPGARDKGEKQSKHDLIDDGPFAPLTEAMASCFSREEALALTRTQNVLKDRRSVDALLDDLRRIEGQGYVTRLLRRRIERNLSSQARRST
jgi:hypothetical protein